MRIGFTLFVASLYLILGFLTTGFLQELTVLLVSTSPTATDTITTIATPAFGAIMAAIFLLTPFASNDAHALINRSLLSIGKVIAVIALAIMVALILGQVFFRYVLSDAPNWTEEGARFGMLWMTGLMAPLAYRMGGFVSIDMLERALPRLISAALSLLLLGIMLWVLIVAWDRGLNNHVDTLSGRGCSSSLRWPFGFEFGKCGDKFQNNYQYASLWVGVNLLILVNVELMIRQVIKLLGQGDRLKPLSADDFAGAD